MVPKTEVIGHLIADELPNTDSGSNPGGGAAGGREAGGRDVSDKEERYAYQALPNVRAAFVRRRPSAGSGP